MPSIPQSPMNVKLSGRINPKIRRTYGRHDYIEQPDSSQDEKNLESMLNDSGTIFNAN